MLRWTRVFIIASLLATTAVVVVGCGDEEEAEPLAPCQSRGRVSGIAGRVAAPSCQSAVGFADVVLYDQLQFERASTTANADGEFSFTASQAGGDGMYLLRVTKGSFSGSSGAAFELSGGQSDFQIVKVSQ